MAESEDIRPAIGIDLGTTNNRVGIWLDEENRFELISNDHGFQSTPSYVAFTETERLIGDAAKEQVSRNPVNTVFDVKRLIGRKFSDLGTDADKLHIQWPFKVARGVDDKPMIHVEYKGKEKVFSAEDVYCMILGKMKDLAEVYTGSVVNGASVSYPHCFTSAQRQATRNACTMAGFETVTLVNDPICAALAYTLKAERSSLGEKKVVVFDLGGGSLDVTLFSIEEGVIKVKATSGDSQLGGEDFDLRLLHHFIHEIKQKYENDITTHPRVVRRLKKQVERVKLALSSEVETTIQVDSLLEDFNYYSSISRAYFEEMNMDLFEKCIKCVEVCLQRAEVDKADVYEVVLVGGSSRIPKVQELLAEFFNDKSKLNTSINPEEAVICGAAARSGISRGGKAFADYLVVDVIPMSLGLETVGGAMHVMHPRNSSIPRSSEQLFTTVHDDQPGIFIHVYEGESSQTCDNLLIATIELPGILPAPRGIPQILVRLDVDADGILTVSAKDKKTGEKVEVYMGEVDIMSSRVHHNDERGEGLPIQVYHPSLVSENPNDSPSSLRTHELSNANGSSPRGFCEPLPTCRSSIATERKPQEYFEPPDAYESSNTEESRSKEIYEPSPAYESNNIVKSRSQKLSGPSSALSNTAQGRPQEISDPSPAYQPNSTAESREQDFSGPSLAYKPSNAVESRLADSLYCPGGGSKPPQAIESSNNVQNRSLEVLEPAHQPSKAVESRLESRLEDRLYCPGGGSKPPQAIESSSNVQNRSLEVLEPAHQPSNAVESRLEDRLYCLEGGSKPPQAIESSNNVQNRSLEVFEPAHQPSNAVESRLEGRLFVPRGSRPPLGFESSNNVQNRSLEVFEPAHQPSNTVESRLEDRLYLPRGGSKPPLAFESSNNVQNRSLEVLEAAHQPSNAVEGRIEDGLYLPRGGSKPPLAFESSNNVQNRSLEVLEPAHQPSNAVEGRIEDGLYLPRGGSKPPLAFESSNNVQNRSLEVLEAAHQPSNAVEGRIEDGLYLPREGSKPPLAFESSNNVQNRSLAVLEPAHQPSNAVEGRLEDRLYLPRGGSKPPLAFESSNNVQNRSLEVLEAAHQPSNAVESRLEDRLYCPGGGSKPPLAFESSNNVQNRSLAVLEPAHQPSNAVEGRLEDRLYLPRGGSKPPLAFESSNNVQNRSLEVLEAAHQPSNAVESRLEDRLYCPGGGSKPPLAFESSNNVQNRSLAVLEPAHQPSNTVESRSQEFYKPLQAFGSVNSVESLEVLEPAVAHGLRVTVEERSQEFPEASQAHESNSTMESRSQECSGPPASESSNPEESSSRVSLVQEILDTVHVLAPISDFRTHKRECSTFIRRVNMIVPLFEEFKDLELPLSDEVLTCFSSLKAALSTAKDLLLLCSKGSKFWLILEQRKVAEQFLLLNTALLQALDKLPDSLGISDEVREQVDLVHNQLKRSKELEDAVDAQLSIELISILDETNERSPDQLTKLAESFKLDTPSAVWKESQALDGMIMEKEPPIPFPVSVRGFDQISGLLNDLRKNFSSEDLEQREYSKPPVANGSSQSVESSLQESSAPPPRSPYSSSNSMEGNSLECSEPPQVNRDEKIQSQESSAPPTSPLPSNSSNSLEGRSQEFSTQRPRSPHSLSNSVASKSLEYSEPPRQANRDEKVKPQESSAPPTYESSHSFEGRSPQEHSEAPPVYRPSKTFGGRSSEFSEPTHSSSSISENRSQEFSEYSSKPEFPAYSPVQKAWNGLDGGPPEPLPTHRMSSSSESRRHEPSEQPPVDKSSNTSESRRHESVERSPLYRSSSSNSVVSSEEFSGSGPFRAHGGMQNPASDPPELRRTATFADEPVHHSPRALENVRSASCLVTRASDSIIEDVVKKYSWDQVLDMTNDLTKTIGKGGFGAVYLGKLENEKEVAVKILDASSQQGITEFLNEVNLLKRVNHVNLVRLLGYCLDEKQVLIYEFAEEGSIWDHLQVGGKGIDWKMRLNIALQSACGLEYLHTGCHPRIIHRDIKSQNILLTKSFVAKVADFGLSKLGADQDNINKTHVTTMVKGTLGYLDPEYLKTGQLTEKSDVYSFGVVLLEIITGRKPIQNTDRKSFIGDWVEEHYNSSSSSSRGLKSVADPTLGGHFNPKALKLVLNVAKDCIQPYGLNRPEMTEVVHVLRKALMVEHDEKKSSKFFSFLS